MAKNETKEEKQLQRTVENYFTDIISVSLMVPLGDPLSPGCRYGLKSIFWGGSGIGKTDQVRQGAEKVGLELRVIVPGQRQPEDFSGVVVADGAGDVRVACILGAVRDLNKVGKGVIFVDEASTAPPAVQGAMLTMLNDGVVGDTVIEPGVRMILAANLPDQAAGGWGFEAPMANRLAHFYVNTPTPEQWVAWLMGEGVHADVLPIHDAERRLVANWNNVWPRVKGLMAGYTIKARTSLYNQPSPGDPKAGFAWPSPRTWYLAGKAMATVRALEMKSELEEIFVEALVGPGPSTQFMNYIAEADLPDPADVLANGWKIDKYRIDKVYAVYTSIVSYTKDIVDRDERFKAAEKAFQRINDLFDAEMADIAVASCEQMIKLGFTRKTVPDYVKPILENVLFRSGKSGHTKFINQ